MKQPLAHRMRPTNIQEVIGQQHLVGEGKILWRMVQANHFQSMILYGPQALEKHLSRAQLPEVPEPLFAY